MPTARDLLTFRQFARQYPAFSEASLRWLRFNCQSNGFATAFVRVGRRILISDGRFFEAIERQNADAADGS